MIRGEWHGEAPKPAASPSIPLRARTRQLVSDLAATTRLVWSASPRLLTLILLLSLLLALVPAATLWVGKLLVDQVALAIATARSGEGNPGSAFERLAILLALQVAIGAAAALVQ